jgi:hypothetical protein
LRLPRDLAGTEGAEHHVTIRRHQPLRVGTLSSILTDAAAYLEISRSELADALFGR